jgi:copper chaperone CopZ
MGMSTTGTTSTVRITMAIYGLACGGGGSLAIERALARLPGVVRAYVNPATEMAYVEYREGEVEQGWLVEAVQNAGFEAGEFQVRSQARAATSTAATAGAPAGYAAAYTAPTGPTGPAASIDSGPDSQAASGGPGPACASCNGESAGLTGSREVSAPGPRPGGLPPPELGGLRALPVAGRPRANVPLRLALLAGFLVLIMAAGLGLADPQSQAGSESVHSVNMSANGYEPGTLVLPAGRPLVLKLSNTATADGAQGSTGPDTTDTTDTTHQFAVDELGIDVELAAGTSKMVSLPALRPGTYTIYCSTCCKGQIGSNMQGTIIVHDAEGSSQPR